MKHYCKSIHSAHGQSPSRNQGKEAPNGRGTGTGIHGLSCYEAVDSILAGQRGGSIAAYDRRLEEAKSDLERVGRLHLAHASRAIGRLLEATHRAEQALADKRRSHNEQTCCEFTKSSLSVVSKAIRQCAHSCSRLSREFELFKRSLIRLDPVRILCVATLYGIWARRLAKRHVLTLRRFHLFLQPEEEGDE